MLSITVERFSSKVALVLFKKSIRLALRCDNPLLLFGYAVELINQGVDLPVGFFDLALKLLFRRADGLLETLVEGEHHVHESDQVVMQLLLAGITIVDETKVCHH